MYLFFLLMLKNVKMRMFSKKKLVLQVLDKIKHWQGANNITKCTITAIFSAEISGETAL